MANRNVIVTGATGFIGRHVIQRLAKQGAQIRVATRDTEAANFLKPLGEIGQITPIPVNISNGPSIARALNGADQAINLIGILFKSGKSAATSSIPGIGALYFNFNPPPPGVPVPDAAIPVWKSTGTDKSEHFS